MTTPLTVWSNRRFAPADAAAFERAITPHRVRWAASATASNLVGAASDATLRDEADVAYGQPDVDDLLASRRLRLACLSSAGYTRYDRDDLRAHCRSTGLAICNASGVYDEPCAQQALAMILGITRRLAVTLDEQRTSRDWQYLKHRERSTLLGPSSVVLLVGYGAIARRLAELLAPFHAKVHAFRRTPRGDENCPTSRMAEIDDALGEADHVVNLLPLSDETKHAFDAVRFARFRRGANFYNIGRGDTVDQGALRAALIDGQVGHAYLDVTTPEPLPADHSLWTTPNCFITPHIAGGSADEAMRQTDHFAANLIRFVEGRKVVDRIM